MKKIICIDFDGVIHSYTSGWQGVDEIPDPPVEGALEWLLALIEDDQFEPMIYSSRSKEVAGVFAMKTWLSKYGMAHALINQIQFPTQKPAAWLTIDDRAICFQGTFPTMWEMSAFRPWNKRPDRGTWLTDNRVGDVNYPTCPECGGTDTWIEGNVRLCWREECRAQRIAMIVPAGMAL